MTLRKHQQLIMSGFMATYAAVMGALLALSFGGYGVWAMKFILLPLAIGGSALIAIAKLSDVPND
jgi:hypothetical protein